MLPGDEPGEAKNLPPYHRFMDRDHPADYRHKEISVLVRAIRAKENRLVLGLPGMGVSNLLRFLVSRPELIGRKVYFAYLNCTTLNDGLDLEELFDTIVAQFQDQGLGRIVQTGERGEQRLKQVLALNEGDPSDRLVVVADQMDKLLVGVEAGFYHRLKGLTDENKRLCYIFAANPRVEGLIDPDNLLFAGRRLAVGLFNKADYMNAINEEARRLEVDFSPIVRRRLAKLGGGHPGLLRALSSAIAEASQALVKGRIDALIERLYSLDSLNYRCQKIWRELDMTQQMALRSLAGGQPEAIQPETLRWLRRFGLVSGSVAKPKIFSPIFQHFVAAGRDSALEPIRIEGVHKIFKNGQGIVIAGKVFKGSQEVHVSSGELRLIACLKQERKIYTKDEIAAYVYYEEFEQGEAASDTRIENLVRQVRGRLGKSYIKTHHGQGYELLG